jgi:S1-C subfamily serine protease
MNQHWMRRVACVGLIVCASGMAAQTPASRAPAIGRDSVVQRMIEATVQIRCNAQGGGTIPMGSGVVVGDARTVITNHHVVEGCEADEPGSRVQVQAYDGSMTTGTVVRAFPSADVAVLQLAGSLPVAIAPLRSDGTARVMEQIVALGYPGVAQFAGLSGQQARATIGVVSRVAAQDLRSGGPRWVLEHGAPIYPGNSGGPLFDQCGAVLGINTFVPIDRQTNAPIATIAYAVGSRTIVSALSDVLNAPLTFTANDCARGLAGGTKQALVVENARATPDSQLKAFYESAVRRAERWQQDFASKSASRDSAVGDAIAMVGEQATNAQRSTEATSQRIREVETKWERTESGWREEMRRQRIGIVLAMLVSIVGICGAIVAYRRAGSVSVVATSASERADEALRLAERAMAAAERAADRRLDQRARAEVSRIWTALDERPGYAAKRMSAGERTRLVDGSAAPTTDPGISLQIQDGRGPRTIQLQPGMTAYIGRDSEAMEIVAQRYLVPHIVVPIDEKVGDNIVSRCHCSIAHRENRVEVVDLSSNGTYVERTGARLAFGEGQVVPPAATLVLARRGSPYRVRVDSRTSASAFAVN